MIIGGVYLRKTWPILILLIFVFSTVCYASDSFEPNGTSSTATLFSNVKTRTMPVSATLHSSSDVDWYLFYVDSTSQVTVNVYNISSGNVDVEIYDFSESASPLQRGTQSGAAPENLNVVQGNSYVYVKVSASSWTTSISYNLWISVRPYTGFIRPVLERSRVNTFFDLNTTSAVHCSAINCTHSTSPWVIPHAYNTHTGIDYSYVYSNQTHSYDRIYSMFYGSVSEVVNDSRAYDPALNNAAGTYVLIYGPSYPYWNVKYCHLAFQSPLVSTGAIVNEGQYFALMGSTGNSTGKHLHITFKLSQSGAAVCPYTTGYLSYGGAYGEPRQ